ncbi:MAG: hypothetical protein MUF31_06260 [Akkermansiaceae bacterium]|jgi:hypothetical protein|nr:hypothetical protein [Akkermansiaceae bacterium]
MIKTKGLLIPIFAMAMIGCGEREQDSGATAKGSREESIDHGNAASLQDTVDMEEKGEAKIQRRELQPHPEDFVVTEGKPGFVTTASGEWDVRGRMPGEWVEDESHPGMRIRLPETWTPIAKPQPGKPGFVISPYNQKLIDVQGVPPGTLVMDPTYPIEENKHFRVPFTEE